MPLYLIQSLWMIVAVKKKKTVKRCIDIFRFKYHWLKSIDNGQSPCTRKGCRH